MVYNLLKWYYTSHICEEKKITIKEFKLKAKEFSKYNDFQASKGWYEKFQKKYKLDIGK